MKKVIWNYDTSNWDKEESKEVYHEIYDRYPEEEELEEFIESENSQGLEDEKDNIIFYEKAHPNSKKNYVIEVHCGLWWGNPIGYAVKEGMWEAIEKCLQDYNFIYEEKGGVYIHASHHDGTNICRIKELTKAGEKYLSQHNYEDKGEVFHHLFKDHHYSRNPKLFNEMYGW